MNINELDNYRLSDAVRFHDRLNSRLWDEQEQLRPQVRERLLAIAQDFQTFLGVSDLNLEDITISGSNAAYSYTPDSDIDLHLVVRMPEQNDEVYRELFNAKKYQYNDEHDIRIGGADVELYVQPQDQPHVSLGIYSVLRDQWIQVPRRQRAQIDDACVRDKFHDLQARIQEAQSQQDVKVMKSLWDKIKLMRKTGLAQHGEFGCENLVFKMLRRSGDLNSLKQALTQAHDRALSLSERRRKPRQRWGFATWIGEPAADSAGGDAAMEDNTGMAQGSTTGDAGAQSTWDGVSASTQEFLNEAPVPDVLEQFINQVAQRLGIERMPTIHIHQSPDWSETNHSFGRYDPHSHALHVSLPGRHIMDVMRTTAHELAHCRQHEIKPLPADAGETGSPWEDQAHAVAGEIMRDFADAHPDLFELESSPATTIDEGLESLPRVTRQAIAAACMAAGVSGCSTVGQTLNTTRDVARLATQIERAGRAGMQEELAQELKNYARARGGDANAQNQSILYRKEHELKEGGWDDTVTQATVIRPSTVRAALDVMNQFVKQFNAWLAKRDHPTIQMGHPTGSSAHHGQDPEEKIYGDIDLQIVVPEMPQTQGMTINQQQAYWNDLADQWVREQRPKYVHVNSKPGHPLIAVAPDAWVQVDLMAHPTHLAQWGRYRVTPERGTKGLLYGNMFSVLGDLLDLSIQHAGVQYKERDGQRQPFGRTLKNYQLGTISRDIETFVRDIFDHEYQSQTGREAQTAKRDPALNQNPGVDVDKPNIARLAQAIQGLARSFEQNKMYGRGNLQRYRSAQQFMQAFLDRYTAKSAEALAAPKFDKATTPDAQARAQRDREAIAQGTQRVVDMLRESSGYIPTNAQRNDPRFLMALTKDVGPGETGRQANKMALKTNSQGRPALLMKTANLREGRMPQPSQGQGGYRDLNQPLGPETPPTMPAGTVRVDVSDVYDWYKLGQHISNLKGLGRHDFGKGPPSAIVSFGDEETEHKYIKDLEKTGLDTTDIDPKDPNQPPGMRPQKTDPTYNVDEDEMLESLRQEFAVMEEELLGEIRMNPASLRREAAATGATAGMEFEMYVPGIGAVQDDEAEQEPDWDQDREVRGLDDIRDFFHDGEYNSSYMVDRLTNAIWEDYKNSDWLDERKRDEWNNSAAGAIEDWVRNNEKEELAQKAAEQIDALSDSPDWNKDDPEYRRQFVGRYDALVEERVEDIQANMGPDYDAAFEYWEEKDWPDQYNNDDWFTDWLDLEDMVIMSQIQDRYGNIMWPYYSEVEGSRADLDAVADNFGRVVPAGAEASSEYKGRRRGSRYIVEPDGSLSDPNDSNDAGLEFISPPMPVADLMADLDRVVEWAKSHDCYTNRTTGLHINVSVPGISSENLDYVKLALLLGDEYVLKQFGRLTNTYARSALEKIRRRISQRPEEVQGLFDLMRQGLARQASQMIHSARTDKYTSINVKNGYVEFRSPGGDWLNEDIDKIKNTLLRMVVALSAAVDPEKYREEYLKKLYQVLAPQSEEDPVAIFAKYSAGQLPQTALKSFIRQIQLQRQGKKQPPTAEPSAKAPTQPAGGEWTGRWLIRDEQTGQVLHQVGGIGNVQASANQFARQWMQQTGYDHPVEIVPEMR